MILLEKVHKWPSIKGPIVENFLCLYNTKTGTVKWGRGPDLPYYEAMKHHAFDLLNEPFAIAEQLENENQR